MPFLPEAEEPAAERQEVVRPLAPGEEKELLRRASAAFRHPWEDNQKAIDDLLRLLRFRPKNAQARALLIDIYEAEGKYDKAIEQCEEFLRYFPNNRRITNQLQRLREIKALQLRAKQAAQQPPAMPTPAARQPPQPTPIAPPAAPYTPPPAAPYPPPPAAPYTPPPATFTPSELIPYSGWAIAALVSSILCSPCVSLPLSVVAIYDVTARNRRGKTLAFVALGISLFTITVILFLGPWMRQ